MSMVYRALSGISLPEEATSITTFIRSKICRFKLSHDRERERENFSYTTFGIHTGLESLKRRELVLSTERERERVKSSS